MAPTAPTPQAPVRARLCVALLVLLGFALGCSEFVVIGIESELFFSIAYAVLTPVLAITTGRFRRFPLLVTYALVFCAANVAMAFAPSFEVLLGSRVMLGAVSGALLAVGVTYIPELVGAERTSIVISLVYAAFSVAMVIITSVGKMVAHALDWHLVMIGSLVLAVASAVSMAVLYTPLAPRASMPRTVSR